MLYTVVGIIIREKFTGKRKRHKGISTVSNCLFLWVEHMRICAILGTYLYTFLIWITIPWSDYYLSLFFKWPKSIDLATSYSYNSGGGHGGHGGLYLKTSSNSSKLLQTPPDTFQTLPNPVQTCPNPVQMRPNTSKCVKTCPNASKCSKLIQICPNLLLRTFPSKIYFHLKFFFKKLFVIVPQCLSIAQTLHLLPPLFWIIFPYWPLLSIAFWTIFKPLFMPKISSYRLTDIGLYNWQIQHRFDIGISQISQSD